MTTIELRAARKALGLTQAELAARLGVTRDCIARYEGGSRIIPRVVELAVFSLKEAGQWPNEL